METNRINTNLQNLPEDVRIHILSFLNLREAVRTSALTKDWQNIWKYSWKMASKLVLDQTLVLNNDGPIIGIDGNNNLSSELVAKFVSRVDNVLQHHQGFGLESLNVTFSLDEKNGHDLDRWILFALKCGLKELSLVLSPTDYNGHLGYRHEKHYMFPCEFFLSERGLNLEYLQIVSASFKKICQGFDGFQKLKTLVLSEIVLNDDDARNLLSNCLHLENLSIKDCPYLQHLRINTELPRLHYLCVEKCLGLKSIGFVAVNLASFECNIEPYITFTFTESSNLTTVSLNQICIEGHDSIFEYVSNGFSNDFPNVKVLSLALDHNIEKLDLSHNHGGFANLKSLQIDLSKAFYRTNHDELYRLIYFFRAAPLLETFKLNFDTKLPSEECKKRATPNCTNNHLRNVQITGFGGKIYQVQLIKFILRNAIQLQIIEINRSSKPHVCNDVCARAYRYIKKEIEKEIPRHCKFVMQ